MEGFFLAGDAIPWQIVGKIIRRDWDGRFQRARGGGRGFGGLQVARRGEGGGGKSGGESMAGRGGWKVEEDGNGVWVTGGSWEEKWEKSEGEGGERGWALAQMEEGGGVVGEKVIGGNGGEAIWRRRRRLEGCPLGFANKARGGGGLGGGTTAARGGAAAVATAEAAVGLLPCSSLSSHLRGMRLLSFFK